MTNYDKTTVIGHHAADHFYKVTTKKGCTILVYANSQNQLKKFCKEAGHSVRGYVVIR